MNQVIANINLDNLHFEGLIVGLATFLIIGIFHPIVIKCHYHFGVKCWWWFLILGVAMCVVSMALESTTASTLTGVVAFSSFWTIHEIFEQRKRVQKGWFPANPKRPHEGPSTTSAKTINSSADATHDNTAKD